MSPLQAHLTHPEPHGHLLQLYQADESALIANVVAYLAEGFQHGDGVLVIAGPQHRRAFLRRLKTLVPAAGPNAPESPVSFLDAQATLDRFMTGDQPDWNLFESTISGPLRQLQSRARSRHVRAYGEMVGLLWTAGQKSGAIRLEEFWNKIIATSGCSLFCGYPVDIFDPEFQSPEVHQLLQAHTHLIPFGDKGDLEAAIYRATHDVLGADAPAPHVPPASSSPGSTALIPVAEASVLSLRTHLPHHADQILSRARQHYQTDKRFRALVENSSDAISLLNRNGRVLYATPASSKVLGYEPAELLGQNAFQLIHPDDVPRALDMFRQTLATPRSPLHLELRLRRKNGQWAWIESVTSNLLDQPEIRAIVSNYRDITERKAAEEEKQRQAEKLQRSNAELEAFAYAVAHDLKEPLRSVAVFTELLLQRMQATADQQELASYIVDGVERMSALLDDLLAFSGLSVHGPLEPIGLSCAAGRAIKNLETSARETGAVITLDPLPSVQGNESHLMQLFQNLIANAIKYRGEQPPRIHITAVQVGPQWMIKVKDNGIGIAPPYREQVFGLFKRLHGREIPGTGIGLAICKKIVEDLGGKIWIEPNGEQGSIFCFTITALDPPPQPAATLPVEAAQI